MRFRFLSSKFTTLKDSSGFGVDEERRHFSLSKKSFLVVLMSNLIYLLSVYNNVYQGNESVELHLLFGAMRI
jgi:hypothetical protein